MCGTLPEPAYAAAVASVARIPAKRLRSLLAGSSPSAVWEDLRAGRWEEEWRVRAAGIDVGEVWEAHRSQGIEVLVFGRPGYPAVLAGEPDAPGVLFAVGRPGVVDRYPRVAVIGTRSATRYGLGVAAQLGADLATTGVAVVSGLAPGIDGAAHEGAVAGWGTGEGAGPPVGVTGGGLDGLSRPGSSGLRRRVAEAGVVLSEWPAGLAELPWRLVQRQRITAALAEVVVVVESHAGGGPLHAVRAAARRGIPVGAVPGSVRSPASAGSNDLLADGCFVVRDAADVLTALGLARAAEVPVRRRRPRSRAQSRPTAQSRPAATGPTATVLEAVEWEPSSLEQVLARTGLPLGVVSSALEQLRADGLVHGEAGWWERV